MRSKTILALLFLFSVGLVAVLVIRALPQRQAAVASAPVAKDEILVAAQPLAAATLLRAQDVMWQVRLGDPQGGEIVRPPESTRNAKPETDDKARAEVYGAALRTAVAAGQPIMRGVYVKPGDRDFFGIVLAPGTRAISVPVSISGGSELLFPGDQVDVILTQTFKNEDAPLTRRSVSETVVEDLRVLAIDRATRTGNGATQTVTVEVVRDQAEKINVAAELGKLSLTLRSVGDTTAGGSGVKQTWAGDVSPALRAATPPAKVIQAERPAVRIMRGSKSEDTKTE